MLSAMFKNWVFTVMGFGHPVSKKGSASTAWWTCLIEAVAKGIILKFVNKEHQDGPKEEAIMLWAMEKYQFTGGWCTLFCMWQTICLSSSGSMRVSARYGSEEVYRRW